jgi:hypothetical protein
VRALRPAAAVGGGILVLAILQAFAAAGRLAHGGLYQDDWPITFLAHFNGFGALYRNLETANHLRPLGALYFALTTAISHSPSGHGQTLISFLVHLAACAGVFLLALRFGAPWPGAVALAALVLLFPASDAVWLWYAASVGSAGLVVGLLACAASLHGARQDGRRGLAWEFAAGILFGLSVLVYQLASVVALLVALIGLRDDRRRAARRLAINLVCVAAAALVPLALAGSAGTSSTPADPVGAWLGNAAKLADGGATVLVAGAMPFRAPHRNVVLPVLLALVAVAALLGRGEGGEEVRRWLRWAAAGAAVVVAAYLVYVPAKRGAYVPVAPASANRVNILAGVGDALLLFAVAMALGAAVARRAPRRGTGALVSAGLLAFLLVGYYRHVHADARVWDRVRSEEVAALARLRALGALPAGSTDLITGVVPTGAPGIDVFHFSWQLNSAVSLTDGSTASISYPVAIDITVQCEPGGVIATGPPGVVGDDLTASYGTVYFTDLRSGRRVRINSPRQCARARRWLIAGALG